MKLLFINRVYPPAQGATGFLLQELAEAFAEKGHDVWVIATALEQGGEVIPEGNHQASYKKVKVIRVKGLAFDRSSHFRRALAYSAFYPSFLLKALRLPKLDAIFTMTDPPLQLVFGPLIRTFKGGRLIHWAQDLYPELAEALGILRKNSVGARVLKNMSTRALQRHNLIVAVGAQMKERLRQRGLDPGKIVVIPNWAQEQPRQNQEVQLLEQIQQFRSSHQLDGKFVVMYSGNFGLAHDFTAISAAIPVLARKDPNIRFLFVGGGPKYDGLKSELSSLPTVEFMPFQPKSLLHISLGAADLHLASMKEEMDGLVVPSKVYGILAAGKPCLFVGPREGDAARFLLENDCGTVVPPHSTEKLLKAIRLYRADHELLHRHGANALKAMEKLTFAETFKHFSSAIELGI